MLLMVGSVWCDDQLRDHPYQGEVVNYLDGEGTWEAYTTNGAFRVDKKNVVVPYVWISHSHLFNELDIHATFMCTYIYPLSLVTHSLIHKLTQAIMHAYVTLDPQGRYHIRFGKSKVDR